MRWRMGRFYLVIAGLALVLPFLLMESRTYGALQLVVLGTTLGMAVTAFVAMSIRGGRGHLGPRSFLGRTSALFVASALSLFLCQGLYASRVAASEAWCEARVSALDDHVAVHGRAPTSLAAVVDPSTAPRLLRRNEPYYADFDGGYRFWFFLSDGSYRLWSSRSPGWYTVHGPLLWDLDAPVVLQDRAKLSRSVWGLLLSTTVLGVIVALFVVRRPSWQSDDVDMA